MTSLRIFLIAFILFVFTAIPGCATFPVGGQARETPLPQGHPEIPEKTGEKPDPKVDAYAGYMMGLLLSDEGRYDEALEYLEMSARLDSSSPAPLIQVMRIYAETERSAEAAEAGRKALEIDPDLPEVHLALGQILLKSDRPGQALEHIRKGVQHDPGNTTALFLLSEALEKTGHKDEAVKILEGLAETEGHEALAHYYIARIQADSGEIEEAVGSLVKAVELNPSFIKAVGELGEMLQNDDRTGEAIDLFENYLRRDPERSTVREYLAKLLLMEERYDEARYQLDLVLNREEGTTGTLLLLGLLEDREGNKAKALEIFNRLREASGSSYEILMQIGSLQRELKMYFEAASSFEEAAAISPERYEPYLNLAIVHDAEGDMVRAEESARKALSLEPGRSNIRAYLAQVLTRSERFDEAIDLLNEGLVDNPEDTTLLYQLGITHDANGQFDLTVEAMEKLLKVDPNHADALNYLGYSWADRDMNLDKALEFIKRALQIRPDAAHIIDSLGWVYYRMGNYEEALKYLLKAAEKMSDDPTVLDHIGDTYAQLGQEELAMQYWSRALAADPENEEIARKLRKKDGDETGP